MAAAISPSISILLVIVLASISQCTSEDQPLKNYTYQDLKPCLLSSFELGALGPDDNLEPCIIFEELPTFLQNVLQDQRLQPKEPIYGSYNGTSVISMVQVTPSNCFNHRDGAPTGVRFLNRDNDGKGVAVGFAATENARYEGDDPLSVQQAPHYAQFHFVSVVAGNPAALSEQEYNRRHVQILTSMVSYLDAPYIVGSCSFASDIEKLVANEHKAFLMAQVGPPGFYTDNNPYLFGFHINSDLYPIPNVRSLAFLANKDGRGGPRVSKVPIKVVYRTKSDFFYRYAHSLT